MTRRLVIAAVTGCLLVSVTGCPSPGERSAERTAPPPAAVEALPGRPTDASTDLPSYAGPPAGAPASLGPLTRLLAAVDLSSAAPDPTARAHSAVAAPDGGAFVVLGDHQITSSARLVTVGRSGNGFAVTGWVPTPDLEAVSGTHLLPDGTVAITGKIFPTTGPAGFGVQVVDPSEGVLRTTIVDAMGNRDSITTGASALSPDGRTLFLYCFVENDGIYHRYPRNDDEEWDRLHVVDLATGKVLAARDMVEDVAGASLQPAGRGLSGLVARPSGGVTLAFDAFPVDGSVQRIPTLLTYDEQLEPVGGPVRVTSLAEDAQSRAMAAAADGTIFLLTEVSDDVWITAVPDGGGAGPILVQLTSWFFRNALFVEPAQVWALLPSYEGARGVDLTTGELGRPVELGCLPDRQVRAMFPAGEGAVLLGECDPRTQMLWFVAP